MLREKGGRGRGRALVASFKGMLSKCHLNGLPEGGRLRKAVAKTERRIASSGGSAVTADDDMIDQ